MSHNFHSSLEDILPRIGLGLAALGRPGYLNLGHADDLNHAYEVEVMEAKTHKVLDAAWVKGIRYFDTARSYGLGEQFLGNWLRKRNIPSEEVAICSKWGYTYTADWKIQAEHHEIKDHSLSVLNRQWGETQQTLGSFLDLYQIHSATLESGVLDDKEVLTRLAELKSAGTAIGLSVSGAKQTEVILRALEVSIDGKRLFDTVQATYNVLEPSAGRVLAEAHREGVGVVVKEALANGRLTSRNDMSGFHQQKQLLQSIAGQQAVSIDALAIGGVLAHDWVDVVLSGAATIEHLYSNLQAYQVVWTEEVEERLRSICEKPETYWEIRKSLVWN